MRRLFLSLLLALLPVSVSAQVVHDNTSESHTASTPSTSETSFSWSHDGAGSGVKGVLVLVFQLNASANDVTSVTYGSAGLSAVSGGSAADTVGELGRATAYFLGASVPQGTQTVVVNRNNNANTMYAVAATVTAGGDTEVHLAGIVLLQENQVPAEQSVTDGSPGQNSVRYAGGFYGNPVISAGANSTLLHDLDTASQSGIAVRETTAGQGSRSIGLTALTDDFAAVHLAIKQSAAASANGPRLLLMGVGLW